MRKYSLWLGLNSTPSFLAFLILSRICHLYMKERFYLELCELVIPLQTIHLCINFILDNRECAVYERFQSGNLCVYFGMYIQIHCLSKSMLTSILLQRNGSRFHLKIQIYGFL